MAKEDILNCYYESLPFHSLRFLLTVGSRTRFLLYLILHIEKYLLD